MSKPADAFAALAHPSRRAILGHLRDRPGMTAGQIAAEFPAVSRPAVSRHLALLRRARLVRARTHGRERRYSVDARPLRDVYESYLRAFEPLWDTTLDSLKRAAEAPLPD